MFIGTIKNRALANLDLNNEYSINLEYLLPSGGNLYKSDAIRYKLSKIIFN